ncbi:hypothetical protein H2200_006517 [Cladophialophora chaetospira]|uniref:Zn(2)-C6 fungal-type domain-containing protein n=1 Tax=Cladophialophora chaetospira TaxID=386627 RepID=A0AA38X8C6_9EURO|nr:hypothetical protein H2200_006517 [Cladophialophora chaetospira]
MTSSTNTWISISDQPQKRKLADVACEYCHSKKIKCDLAVKLTQNISTCSNCSSAAGECRIRPSQRANSGRRPNKSSKISKPSDNGRDALGTNVSAAVPPKSHVYLQPDAIDFSFTPNNGSLPALTLSVSPVGTTNPNHQILPPLPQGGRRMSSHSAPIGANSIAGALQSTVSPNQESTESRFEQSQLNDTGYISIYALENSTDAQNQESKQTSSKLPDNVDDFPDPDLQQGFIETYYEYCYAWCPVIDRSTLSYAPTTSVMLANALALVGSHIKPSILGTMKPEGYYNRARRKFYEDEESDILTALKALSLFYWWSPRPPSTVHGHSSWWWQSVIIRHCQWMGIHREPPPGSPLRTELNLSIRRRIWWTAFARERLTAICQGRPAIIDPEDCNIQEPTVDDFEDTEKPKGEIFIYWVRLCAIIGRIAKHTSRSPGSTTAFPPALAQELISWVNSLPLHLQLPIGTRQTENFNRDVHQLHLPYLAMVIILHLKKSTQPLPQAYPPAVLAASCMARIFKDILARSDTRYLMGITCWYCGVAFMALRQACRSEDLRKSVNEELDILEITMNQLRLMWPTGNIFHSGFRRLRADMPPQVSGGSGSAGDRAQASHANISARLDGENAASTDVYDGDGIEWTSYFPFATAQTSAIAEKLLTPELSSLVMDDFFPADTFIPDGTDLDFGPFFEPFGGDFNVLDNFT